jgi:hypothetical protein
MTFELVDAFTFEPSVEELTTTQGKVSCQTIYIYQKKSNTVLFYNILISSSRNTNLWPVNRFLSYLLHAYTIYLNISSVPKQYLIKIPVNDRLLYLKLRQTLNQLKRPQEIQMKEVLYHIIVLNLLRHAFHTCLHGYMYLLKERQASSVCIVTSIESLSIQNTRQNLSDTYVIGVASFLLRTRRSLNNKTNSKRKSFRHYR